MDNQGIRKIIADIFEELAHGLETGAFCGCEKTRVGITILGSELGVDEVLRGAELAQSQKPDLEVVVIGTGVDTSLELVEAKDEEAAHTIMDQMLSSGQLDSAVTMHYNFPIGVSTVGRVITPGKGKELFLATTTGTSATKKLEAMLRNTIYGIATAKACGKLNPTVGILNIDGARQVERALIKLKENGYPINFAQSARKDGGILMRGNDLILGVSDVMVMDSLTGNVLMKMFADYNSGGNYEAFGYGYGPGVGENYDRIICIISRASGAPVVAGAIRFAGTVAKGKILDIAANELALAKKAGLGELFCPKVEKNQVTTENESKEIKQPPAKPITAEIPGIEVFDLEDAVQILWKAGIYAQSGMGCTGPIVMVASEDLDQSYKLLKEAGFI